MWECCSKSQINTHKHANTLNNNPTKSVIFLFNIIFLLFDSDAFDFEYGTVILRMNEGLDMAHIVEAEGQFVTQ